MLLEHMAADDRPVNIFRGIDADAFGSARLGRARFEIFDEPGDAAILRAADANALLHAGRRIRRARARLRVRHVDRIVLRDEDAARPAELLPLVEEASVLIEDLDPVVHPVADKK